MRVAHSFRAAMLTILCSFLIPPLQATDSTASRLLETLLSPQTSDEAWQHAAEAFSELPADAAIRVLYPEVAKGIPNGMPYATYNCSNPKHDRHVGGGIASQAGCGATPYLVEENTQASAKRFSSCGLSPNLFTDKACSCQPLTTTPGSRRQKTQSEHYSKILRQIAGYARKPQAACCVTLGPNTSTM